MFYVGVLEGWNGGRDVKRLAFVEAYTWVLIYLCHIRLCMWDRIAQAYESWHK